MELIPLAGGCHKLGSLIGRVRASEIILTAAPISAQTAERIGLINRIVAADSLMDEARIPGNSQVAVKRAGSVSITHLILSGGGS